MRHGFYPACPNRPALITRTYRKETGSSRAVYDPSGSYGASSNIGRCFRLGFGLPMSRDAHHCGLRLRVCRLDSQPRVKFRGFADKCDLDTTSMRLVSLVAIIIPPKGA